VLLCANVIEIMLFKSLLHWCYAMFTGHTGSRSGSAFDTV